MTSALAAVLFLSALPTARADDILVITPKEFEPALAAWRKHREARGVKVVVRIPGDDPVQVVRGLAKERGKALRWVLLLGDTEQVRCFERPVKAIAQWEREPNIATDLPYADLDGDDLPDLAVGRLPARTVEEAQAMLARVVKYETSTDHGTWKRKLHLIGGVGGFGAQQDFALEQLTRMVLNRSVPTSADVTFSYAKVASPFCPPPAQFASTFLGQINEGALVVAYVGHGSRDHLDRVITPEKRYPILEAADVANVAVKSGPPLMVLVACSTGSFDKPKPCLAELLMRRPQGPAAVIASSRVSTPYSNAILSIELLAPLYEGGELTTVELLMKAKRALVAPSKKPLRRQMESMAGAFYEVDAAKRALDRAEHVQLYHLFGDPSQVLQRPASFEIEASEEVTAGKALRVTGTAPVAGKLTLELVRRRDAVPPAAKAGRSAAQMTADYNTANRRVLATSTLDVKTGPFEAQLVVPPQLKSGKYSVRIYVQGATGSAMAGTATRVFAVK